MTQRKKKYREPSGCLLWNCKPSRFIECLKHCQTAPHVCRGQTAQRNKRPQAETGKGQSKNTSASQNKSTSAFRGASASQKRCQSPCHSPRILASEMPMKCPRPPLGPRRIIGSETRSGRRMTSSPLEKLQIPTKDTRPWLLLPTMYSFWSICAVTGLATPPPSVSPSQKTWKIPLFVSLPYSSRNPPNSPTGAGGRPGTQMWKSSTATSRPWPNDSLRALERSAPSGWNWRRLGIWVLIGW